MTRDEHIALSLHEELESRDKRMLWTLYITSETGASKTPYYAKWKNGEWNITVGRSISNSPW